MTWLVQLQVGVHGLDINIFGTVSDIVDNLQCRQLNCINYMCSCLFTAFLCVTTPWTVIGCLESSDVHKQ